MFNMQQREVTDHKNTTWTCVQAYTGGISNGTGETPEVKNDNGTVTVVCTPSGGAQTVRLELESGWIDAVSDEALLREIAAAQ